MKTVVGSVKLVGEGRRSFGEGGKQSRRARVGGRQGSHDGCRF